MFAHHAELTSRHLAKDVFALVLAGEIDLNDAPRMSVELTRLMDAGARKLVVDLVDATFIDSTALGVLLEARTKIASRGGRLVLVIGRGTVRRVLELTGLHDVFDVAEAYDDRGGANGHRPTAVARSVDASDTSAG